MGKMTTRDSKGCFKPVHGVDFFLRHGQLPRLPGSKKVNREAESFRRELLAKYGGEHVSPEAEAIISTIVDVMKIKGLIGLYLGKAGILRRDELRRGNLEMHGILAKQYIAYLNLLNRSVALLQALKVEKGGPLDITEYIQSRDAAQESGEGEKGPGKSTPCDIPGDGETEVKHGE